MKRRRNKTVVCRSCHVRLLHRARGYCDACYAWHARYGWDVQRPAPPTACVDCGRPWSVAGRHRALGRCERCYRRTWRAARMAA